MERLRYKGQVTYPRLLNSGRARYEPRCSESQSEALSIRSHYFRLVYIKYFLIAKSSAQKLPEESKVGMGQVEILYTNSVRSNLKMALKSIAYPWLSY